MGSTAESTNIRHLVDGGGLAVTDPDLPFFCYLKAKVNAVLFKVMCIAVGKFYGPLLICTRADHPTTGVLLKLPMGDLLALCINAVIAHHCRWPATSSVHYTTNCNTQSSAPEDG